MKANQLFGSTEITQALNMATKATESMFELTDCDLEIVKARFSVVRELAAAFGISDEMKIPCIKVMLVKRYVEK